jgi:hypothetical protein
MAGLDKDSIGDPTEDAAAAAPSQNDSCNQPANSLGPRMCSRTSINQTSPVCDKETKDPPIMGKTPQANTLRRTSRSSPMCLALAGLRRVGRLSSSREATAKLRFTCRHPTTRFTVTAQTQPPSPVLDYTPPTPTTRPLAR